MSSEAEEEQQSIRISNIEEEEEVEEQLFLKETEEQLNLNDNNTEAALPSVKSDQIWWLLGLAKSEIWLLIVGTLALGASSVVNLLLPKYIGTLIDTVLKAEGRTYLNTLIFSLFLLTIVMAVTTFIRALCFNLAGERVVAKLRRMLFNAIIGQEIAFFDETKTGELLNRLSSDTKSLENAVTVNISMCLRFLVQIVGSLFLLFTISWKLCLVMLSLIPPMVIGTVIYGRYVKRLSKSVQDALAKSSDVAEESLSNIRTVRSFGQEIKHKDLYSFAITESYNLAKKLAVANGVFSMGMIVAGNMALILVIWYGGHLVLKGELTIGVLTSFLIYTLLVAVALGVLSSVFFETYKALGATERVYQIITRVPNIERRIESEPNGITLSELKGHLRFENVDFVYQTRPENKVLRGFSLDVEPGKIIALVGESGGGKSSCISLIQRFYDPQEGTITLDGVPLCEFDTLWLRHRIGVVSQEPSLFAVSIAENISYGCVDRTSTKGEIIEAAKQANAHNFICEFKEGYDTLVGERGVRLSGGQKQRIAIARAILKQPKLLLLDEATSALDSESEYLVQRALENLMANRTTIIIAHRLSTVKKADMICVVSKGTIVETGTHDELIRQNGAYKALIDKQLFQSN
jgi:ABC-type multidrug transport system fused ATPase/permease subunit